MQEKSIEKIAILIVMISAVIRSFLAATLDLGNDEVYYISYALYPDLSHFDHPPMVGWMIQIFTLNLLADKVFFIRLASIILGTASSWLIFLLAKFYGTPRSGLLAVVLYTASIYASIISGVFILPDTPQVFFWLLSSLCFAYAFQPVKSMKNKQWYFVFGCVSAGLAILSKYTSVFIVLGVVLYILFYQREWLTKKMFYFGLLLIFAIQVPVILWNIQHDFISFTYQGGRIIGLSQLRFDYFATEILGEFLYNNPINIIIIIIAMIMLVRHKKEGINNLQFLLLASFPLILVFWMLSLFHSTLPHWTGPAYVTLLAVAAVVYDRWTFTLQKRGLIPLSFRLSLFLAVFIVFFGYLQINTGILTRPFSKGSMNIENVDWDISLDMYGWKQIKKAMPEIYHNDITEGIIGIEPVMLSWRWFPAANLDYYVAQPMGLKLYAFGDLGQIHKYYWINRDRGLIPEGKDAYFICTSRDKKDPETIFRDLFENIDLPDTIPVIRSGRRVMDFYVYRLHHCHLTPEAIKSSFADPPIQ